jgi:hypothetical protein
MAFEDEEARRKAQSMGAGAMDDDWIVITRGARPSAVGPAAAAKKAEADKAAKKGHVELFNLYRHQKIEAQKESTFPRACCWLRGGIYLFNWLGFFFFFFRFGGNAPPLCRG